MILKKTLLPSFLFLFFALTFLVSIFFAGGCDNSNEVKVLKLATTTSTEDSGLLDELLPLFEKETGYNVDVIATGTGQALEFGRRGDVDILLVHAKKQEKEFVEEGYGTKRYPVMHNDFLLVGPKDDPAGIKEAETLKEALKLLYESGQENTSGFASRGDESGTHQKEKELWKKYEIDYKGKDWHDSMGQGMGETLITTNELKNYYTLSDKGTYLAMKDRLENLQIVKEKEEILHNPYGIIPVNPEKSSNISYNKAMKLVEFFQRNDIQEKISQFGKEKYGEPLFFTGSSNIIQ